MASETSTLSIKLLIDQSSNVVLLAEAGSDFVNTPHSLLKLPLGNIAQLADKHEILQPETFMPLRLRIRSLTWILQGLQDITYAAIGIVMNSMLGLAIMTLEDVAAGI
ncbi:hypothetical protein V6N11_084390 [Hibiscus sabdariffa]|uniref:Uncharacterized protein n=2 Tax=Hibiscus sabdariffa TaxID=183260 RepID=A0ABR2B5E9_9ROSI